MTEEGPDVEWRSQRVAVRDRRQEREGKPCPTYSVLRHTGLEFPDLGVQCPGPSAVPVLLLPPALLLQLLEL